jgi:hypothetical protein
MHGRRKNLGEKFVRTHVRARYYQLWPMLLQAKSCCDLLRCVARVARVATQHVHTSCSVQQLLVSKALALKTGIPQEFHTD